MSLRLVTTVALAALLAAAAASAQFGFRSRFRNIPLATAESFDGRFQYCRVMYQRGGFGRGGGWSTDYPSADRNLSIRLAELTTTRVSEDETGEPRHLVVRLTDPELFRCPFIMMLEVGALYLDEPEAAQLRSYLLKGGFLWVDDFWGSRAWDNWETEIRKVFSPAEFPIVDLTPDHPLFHALYDVPRMPQIPSINFWYGSGRTSERGADSAEVHTRAILDAKGRMMVLMTHNTDISDSWEREGDDTEYFYRFSVDGYAVGINTVLYAMTH